jgi:hypothetical protein
MKVVVRYVSPSYVYPTYYRSPGAGEVVDFKEAHVYDTKNILEWIQMMTYWYDKEYCCLINVSDLGV